MTRTCFTNQPRRGKILFYLLLCALCLTFITYGASFKASISFANTRSNVISCVDRDLPVVYMVNDPHIYYYFEDWVSPLIFSLGMAMNVVYFSVKPDIEQRIVTLQDSLRAGDTVLLLQQSFNIQMKDQVQYWFLNTEGPDKPFIDVAVSIGIKNVIDYSTFNAARHLENYGTVTSLWLPIISSSSVTIHDHRDKMCMVGGANTERRKKFRDEFNTAALQLGADVSVFEIHGWNYFRDYASQTCALVVNVASVENNHATPRLRLDILWQFDVPIISEEMSGNETLEYNGTVTFVPMSELINATLKQWEIVTSPRNEDEEISRIHRVELKVAIQKTRRIQFQKVVQAITWKSILFHLNKKADCQTKD